MDEQCRLCGINRKGGRRPKEKHREDILLSTGIDVLKDHDGTPLEICHACIKKLQREKKKRSRKGGSFASWQVPEFPEPVPEELTFSTFLTSAQIYCQSAGFVDCSDSQKFVAVQLNKGTGDLRVKVEVCSDFSWKVYQNIEQESDTFQLKLVSHAVPMLSCIPEIITSYPHITALLSAVQSPLCEGNLSFTFIINHCKMAGQSALFSRDGKTVVGYFNGAAIHSTECDVFVSSQDGNTVCSNCSGGFRNNLRAREYHLKRFVPSGAIPQISSSSRAKFSSLSDSAKALRAQCQSSTIHSLRRKISKLEDKVRLYKMKESLQDESVKLDGAQTPQN